MPKKIYLDYAATTPLDSDVLEKMQPFFTTDFGNPSSVHSMGQSALEAIDEARQNVANFLNSSPSEIIFTSGATESNNLAIRGVLSHYYTKNGKNAPKPHFITSTIEHHCVLETIEELEKMDLIETTFLPVTSDGLVELDKINEAVRENTIFISIMYVNNEIGTIQPIEEIGKLIKKLNADRKNKIIFHSDAVQAINYLNCDVEMLGVDLLSFSAHKFYGPKGAGALYIKKGISLKRIQTGGAQEFNLRAGTQNVTGIVGLGEALLKVKSQNDKEKIKELRNYLIEKVLKEIPNSYLNGHREKRSPNNANFRFDNIEGEGLLLSLDMEGICASTGSACSSGSLDPSHVLLALGLRHEQAHGSLRLTIGKHTTQEEIDFTVEKIKEIVARLREISGNVLSEFK